MRPHRALVAAALTAVMLGAAPAPADDPRAGGHAIGVPTDVAVTPSMTQILTAVDSYRDVDAWLSATAAAVELTSGVEPVTAARTQGTSDQGAVAWVHDAGDLNGDGRSDVMTYRRDVGTDVLRLQARRGDTARPLWKQVSNRHGGIALPLLRDVTGDGAADLLLFELELLSGDPDACYEDDDENYCWSLDATFRWTVSLISGRDGAAAWTRTLDGSVTQSRSPAPTSPAAVRQDEPYESLVRGVNLHVVPFIADLDGDGAPEVVVNAIDFNRRSRGTHTYARTGVAGVGRKQGVHSLESKTRVTVVDARGRAARRLRSAGSGSVAYVSPITQPDGSSDLLWRRQGYSTETYGCTYVMVAHIGRGECGGDLHPGGARHVALVDGHTFREVWSSTLDESESVWPVGGDLDGDGYTELLRRGYNDRPSIVSGRSGRRLWDVATSVREVLPIGSLNDRAGDDVLTITYRTAATGDREVSKVVLQRRDGATGRLLFQTTHSARSTRTTSLQVSRWMYVGVGADGSGDATSEVVVGTVTRKTRRTGDDYESTDSASAVVESGATGDVLYRFAGRGQTMLSIGGDFDGDGLADAVKELSTYTQGREHRTFAVVRLIDGSPLWSDNADGYSVRYATGADADGDGGDDVYRIVDQRDENDRQSSLITALDGRTGAARWTVSSRR